MARPKIAIDTSRVEELAAQGLTQEEIALCLGISERTLRNHKRVDSVLAAAIKRGKAKAASEIANTLYQMARNKDLGAIIWWEKTRRGLSDRAQVEHSGPSGGPIPFDYHVVAAEITRGSGDDSDASS